MRKRSEVTSPALTTRERLHHIIAQLKATFIGRDDAIEAIVLAHLIGQNYLLVGTPGTAKSSVSNAFVKHVTGARHFKCLFGAFTTPSKVFGPMDVEAFTDRKKFEYAGEGKLQDTELATLEEIMKSSDGMCNELLGVLNEREFMEQPIPLWCCGMNTNWPELERRSDKVEALYDRALLRVACEDLTTADELVAMMEASEVVRAYQPEHTVELDELKEAREQLRELPIHPAVRRLLAELRIRLATRRDSSGNTVPNVVISARRLAAMQDVLRASAWLAGPPKDGSTHQVTVEHFQALRFTLWVNRGDIEQVRACLNTVDAEGLQRVNQLINEGNQVVSDYASKRNGVDGDILFATINRVAPAIRAEYDKPIFTERSRQAIARDMHALNAAYTKVKPGKKEPTAG